MARVDKIRIECPSSREARNTELRTLYFSIDEITRSSCSLTCLFVYIGKLGNLPLSYLGSFVHGFQLFKSSKSIEVRIKLLFRRATRSERDRVTSL